MVCKMCKVREVQDKNPKIKVCDICRIELELAFTYSIGGKEVTQGEFEREMNNHFRRLK